MAVPENDDTLTKMGAPERMGHVFRRVRSDGVGAAARHSLDLARAQLYLVEEHVWYQLDLDGERPRRELPEEVRLLRAERRSAGRSRGDGPADRGGPLERRAAGNDLWLAEDDGGPLFRCWIYRERAPVLAAPGGWLDLPADTVVLEDSATTPRARGRGIAPGAWTAIADSLRDEGLAHMITKVGVENEASRKAVAKSGFREIGVMRMVKRGPRKHTTVSEATPGLGTELAARPAASARAAGARDRQRLARCVGQREQAVALALRQAGDGGGERQPDAHAPGLAGAPPVAAALREQALVAAPEARVALGMPRGAARELAPAVHAVAAGPERRAACRRSPPRRAPSRDPSPGTRPGGSSRRPPAAARGA